MRCRTHFLEGWVRPTPPRVYRCVENRRWRRLIGSGGCPAIHTDRSIIGPHRSILPKRYAPGRVENCLDTCVRPHLAEHSAANPGRNVHYVQRTNGRKVSEEMVTDASAPGARLAIGGFVISGLLLTGATLTSPFPFGNPFGDLMCRSGVARLCPQPVAIDLPPNELRVLPSAPSRVVGYGAVSGLP